jgi:TrmH family RNA methyltransferase
MQALQQIGLRHPRIQQIRHVAGSGVRQDRQLLLAEGLWAHDVLMSLDPAIEMFLWCPEAAYSAEARALGARVAARARCAYRIAPAVLERLCERERPDGLLSLVRLPAWDPGRIELHADALVLVADAIEIPGNLGTLLRTLDACGSDCLIVTNRRARGKITIPMHGRVDSLNVAVSASILMYDVRDRTDAGLSRLTERGRSADGHGEHEQPGHEHERDDRPLQAGGEVQREEPRAAGRAAELDDQRHQALGHQREPAQ